MKDFIVLFREPDGRANPHSAEEIKNHQLNWKNWFEKWGSQGKLNGGSGLTLNGRTIRGANKTVTDDIHRVGTEIVGGYLLLKARDMEEATEIIKSCPIFEFEGYAEIRETQA